VIFRWLRQRRELAAGISAEAESMIALFGDSAYYKAGDRVLAARQSRRDHSYWSKVRGEIARRTRRDWVDTATRYLNPDGSIRVWPRPKAEESVMKATKNQLLDIREMEAAFKRAAHSAVHGTREERSSRFISLELVSTKYDVVSGELEVRFVNGRTFRYSDVSPAVYKALVDAESKPAFFNAKIRHRYPYREL
jgi:lysyl-tRNA synthetase class 2